MGIKYLVLTNKKTGVHMGFTLDMERMNKVSAKIWLDIQSAVKEVRPDLLGEFDLCRNREAICTFLEKHFPLDPKGFSNSTSWSVQLMSQTPDILRKGWGK